MYSKEFVRYVVNERIDEKHKDLALNIINLIPKNGVLKMTSLEISVVLSKDESEIIEVFEVLKSHKTPLVVWKNNTYIFDYPEKDIKYVRRLRNAISNCGLTIDDFVE